MITPVFDDGALTRLKRMISASRVEQVLTLYLEMSPLRMAEVHDGLREQNLERVARALHDMKSSAGMIGARRVEQLAHQMEQDAMGQDHAALNDRLPELNDAVTEAERWVTENRPGS